MQCCNPYDKITTRHIGTTIQCRHREPMVSRFGNRHDLYFSWFLVARPRCGICQTSEGPECQCRKTCFHLSESRPCCVPRAWPRVFRRFTQRSCIHNPFESEVPRCQTERILPCRYLTLISLPLPFTLPTKTSESFSKYDINDMGL